MFKVICVYEWYMDMCVCVYMKMIDISICSVSRLCNSVYVYSKSSCGSTSILHKALPCLTGKGVVTWSVISKCYHTVQ